MVERKRRPGGGRKPKGEFPGKSATLTTRITPDLRKDLEREARHNGRSLSQEVEARLRGSVRRDAWGGDENRSLGLAIARLATWVSTSTGKPWLTDPFTFEAFREGIATVMARLAPAGEVKIPEKVAAQIKRFEDGGSPTLAQMNSTPAGFGNSHAMGLIGQMCEGEETAEMGGVYIPWNADLPRAGLALGLQKDNR